MKHRTRRVLPLMMGPFLLLLGWGCNGDPFGPDPVCSGGSDPIIVTFEDSRLEAAVRSALSVAPGEDLTCPLVSELTALDASSSGIVSLRGLENFTNLETLNFFNNSIKDIRPLSRLERLESLNLSFNRDFSDVEPLLVNTGFGEGDLLYLGFSDVSCEDYLALEDKGVAVNPTANSCRRSSGSY